MKIEIRATEVTTDIDGVPVRMWEGITENGIKCKVFVHRLMVHRNENAEQFEKELKEQIPPGRAIPLRLIL